jgi:hypothetical protein
MSIQAVVGAAEVMGVEVVVEVMVVAMPKAVYTRTAS